MKFIGCELKGLFFELPNYIWLGPQREQTKTKQQKLSENENNTYMPTKCMYLKQKKKDVGVEKYEPKWIFKAKEKQVEINIDQIFGVSELFGVLHKTLHEFSFSSCFASSFCDRMSNK